MFTRRIYLDRAAGVSANPSSPHDEGLRAKETLETARKDIAALLEVKADDVVFTSGATQANALALLGSVRAAEVAQPHILYLPSSHASVVENVKLLGAEGVVIESLPIKDARVDVAALKKLLRSDTVLVSMDAVCGETGVIWNTREVRAALDLSRAPGERRILLHVDASQAPLTENCTRSHFGADLLTLDVSKVGPFRGIGCLVAHRTIPIAPLYKGGGQERGLVPGSESVELAQAFAEALKRAATGRARFRARADQDRTALMKGIAGITQLYINEGRAQAPHILNISLVGRDTDYLVALLNKAGFAVSTRSACETDSEEGSRAVLALTGDIERAKSTLRISWGPEVSSRNLTRFVRALREAVAFVDSEVRG